MTPDDAPLILTLALDADSVAFFERMRRAHFPPERNVIAAHLTMFHALPGPALGEIVERLAAVAARTPPLALTVPGVRFMGHGTAYEIESAALKSLRAGLARGWAGWLTKQDAQGWRPHVTVQNKVSSGAAKALFAELRAGFEPFAATGTGLSLWHYRGGPWERAADVPFSGPEEAPPRP